MADLTKDILAEQPYGKAALAKLAPVATNFRLYEAGWLGAAPPFYTMKVVGAEFRVAKAGPNKGKLSVMVPGTKRIAYVSKEAIAKFEPVKKRKTKAKAGEKACTKNLENGYYYLTTPDDTQNVLVYLYEHPDFKGIRHIAYGAQDGGAIMPVTDLRDDCVLKRVSITEV